ncbi:MAG: cupredoxin domain-containing protein [Candidatus Poseidoniia archaeon]|nr:cupredoxin domain-containing protein [Candidatus Poseidoniia archaeon]
MRQSLFLAVMLCLTPMLTGCLDSLTGDEELRAGCTYTEAENWDPLAQIDDGSCVLSEPVLGCTYADAENYSSTAELDDGSCTFAEPVTGCTDSTASNYNPYAEYSNDSCEYVVEGCTDPAAENYDDDANTDDSSCTYAVEGCTYDDASNYDPDATVDDGSCEYPVYGCTDEEAMNYDPDATEDDSSCEYYTTYVPLTAEELNAWANFAEEKEDYTYWSDDFDRFEVRTMLNMEGAFGEEDNDNEGEGGDEDDEGDGDKEEEETMYLVSGMQKDDANQIFSATFGMQMEGEGNAMIFRQTSVRQGSDCSSSDCTLTNEIMEVELMSSEDEGNHMHMQMEEITRGRDEVPYYGDPVAELWAGDNILSGEEEVHIDIADSSYTPEEIEIAPGTIVFWHNNEESVHTVTADDGSFDSGDIAPYNEWSYTFEDVGDFSYSCDYHGSMGMTGEIIVIEDEDPEWDEIMAWGWDVDGDDEDDWIVHEAWGRNEDDGMNIHGILHKDVASGKLYPILLESYDENDTLFMRTEFWYGDEVWLEIIESDGLGKATAGFSWEADSYDDDENGQNVYKGTIVGNQFMQEVSHFEMEIRVLEAYEEDEDEGPSFNMEEEDDDPRDSARVVAKMTLANSEDDVIDEETGCHWYLKWNDDNDDGLVSVDDSYEIRSDKLGDGGEVCNREDENGNATYAIEFYDLWADAYVDEPNMALPGFAGLFAVLALLGLAGLRRRRL